MDLINPSASAVPPPGSSRCGRALGTETLLDVYDILHNPGAVCLLILFIYLFFYEDDLQRTCRNQIIAHRSTAAEEKTPHGSSRERLSCQVSAQYITRV